MSRQKKAVETPKEAEPLKEFLPVSTELENKLSEQADLLSLRNEMCSLGIDSIGKLDHLLSVVNERVRQLSK